MEYLNLLPIGYQQMTSLATATAPTIPAGCKLALMQAEGQDVRWRDDGTAPTTSVGMILPVGSVLKYEGGGFGALKFIQVAATAKLNITYWGG